MTVDATMNTTVAAIVSRTPRGGLCATLGLAAVQLLLGAILLTGTAGGEPGTGFGLAVFSLVAAGIVSLVGACRARRRAGRGVWGYALGRCALALSPTLGVTVLFLIAGLSGA